MEGSAILPAPPFAVASVDSGTARVGDPARNAVAAVVVTYFPELVQLHRLVGVVGSQVERVLVLDNTPAERAPAELARLRTAACEVFFNGRNLGLGAAQNLGIARARDLGMAFVLLLDQDSLPAENMVARLLAGHAKLTDRGTKVAAVGPRWVDRRTQEDAAFVRYGWGWASKTFCNGCADALIPCDTLVASGSLTPIAAFDRVGDMDASLFIDQIDTEWDMRAARQDLRLYGVCDAVLHHGIGEDSLRIWFLGWRMTPVHNPVRDYYLVRNIVTVFFRRKAFWRWRTYYFFRLIGTVAVMVTQMPRRRRRVRMVLQGLRDAFYGRMGPYEPATAESITAAARGRQAAAASASALSWPRRVKRALGRARRVLLPRRARVAAQAVTLVAGRSGIEIGGPSALFDRHGLLPVYAAVAGLDNCNYAPDTVWGSASAADRFVFDPGRAPGRQWICEATALTPFADGSAGFVLSSHALEHSANPIKALREWRRVLMPDGILLLVLPHKAGTFDHRRPTTALEHMIADAECDRGEDDLTHLEEILALHDLTRDREAGDREAFRVRSLRNVENRALHHHVFDTRAAVQLVDHAGFEIVAVDTARSMHIIVLARRPVAGSVPRNHAFLEATAGHFAQSVFAVDRAGR